MYTLQPLVLREEIIFQKRVSPTQNNRVIWAKDTKINAKKLGKSEKNFLLPWSSYFESLLKSFQWHVKEKTAELLFKRIKLTFYTITSVVWMF